MAQGVGLLVHILTDAAQVAYGRFAPLSLSWLFIISVIASLGITHVIYFIVKNKRVIKDLK
ncbi:MAG: hypothetical protein AABY07_02385 [Nanoarchaeota archaeon]